MTTGAPPPSGPTLRIVSVNDVYVLDNLPRLRNLVRHHAVTAPADAFIVVIAGDFLAPSILSSLDAGRGMVECLRAVGITHAIFGNHEDDVPLAELRLRIAELGGTWLNTNLRGFEPPLPARQILEVAREGSRRVRVGLVGVVMNDPAAYRPLPFGGCEMMPANDAARAEASRLVREDGCACVVPLTHQSMADDRELARAQREPPFPVIVGGHEHVVFLEQVEGTWIVKAGADAAHAVVTDLAWPEAAPAAGTWDLPTVTVRLDDVARYPEDPALRACVDGHLRRVHDLELATLVKLAPGEVLSSVGTRARQTSLGTLICSRVRDALGAEACFFNGGGIRGGREYHAHLTYGDLEAEVPFDNEVVVLRLPGRVLREAVAASRSLAPAESGGFLQVDDRTTVIGPESTVTDLAGAPLAEDREYRVALVRDLLGGMDHIEPLVRFARAHPEQIPPAGSGRGVKMVLVEAFSVALWRHLGGFDAVDANHDGVVTAPEIAAAVARFTAEPPSAITANLLLHALDANHDERVSRSEAEAVGPSEGASGSRDEEAGS
jgi:2',3'-cyclic-nucleotide 2'-phosphodiesterase (5'-nucleotidase family)